MEELFLSAFLACPELYVVYKEDIDIPELAPELAHLLAAYEVYEVVDEPLRSVIADLGAGVVLQDPVAYGLEEVRFAEADAAVDEKRVVFAAGVVGGRRTGGVRELVGLAHDEVLEGVLGAQVKACRLGGLSSGALLFLLFFLFPLLWSRGSMRGFVVHPPYKAELFFGDLPQNIFYEGLVMFPYPFEEKAVGHLELDRVCASANDLYRPEPGREVLGAHMGSHAVKAVFPQRFGVHYTPGRRQRKKGKGME